MSTTSRITLSLGHVVARLEQDIRQRGLEAGDRYLTASEAAEMLSISTTTAHRAMRTLAQKRMLVRRRNRGTFVGPHFTMKPCITNRTVYLLVPPTGAGRDVPLDPFIRGIRSQVNETDVKISFLPRGDIRTYIQELLHSAHAAGKIAGFVAVSCPREVYRRLSDSGMPTVIVGTPYSDQQDIPSIDVDNRTAGRLLAEYLIGGGHRRIALLTPMEDVRPGDNCFYDGVSEALTAHGLPHNALIVRMLHERPAVLAAELGTLLAMPDGPTALMIRSLGMARTASTVLKDLKRPAAGVCEIVCENSPTERGTPPFTCTQPRKSFDEMATQIGEMLERLGRGEALDEQHVMIPVDLCRQASSCN